jgi:integrase
MPIRFYLHTTTYADGRRPIYADIRWGRTEANQGEQLARLRTGTGQSCQPKNLNDKGRVSSAEKGYLAINRALIKLEADAEQHIGRAEMDSVHLTPEALLALLKPKAAARKQAKEAAAPAVAEVPPVAAPTMLSLYADWQQAYAGRRAAKTLAGPQGLIDQLERWRPGTRPEELQPDASGRCKLFEQFCQYCLTEAKNRKGETGLLNNTLSSYVKRLSKLLKFGRYATEWLEDDFSEEVEREPLTFAEVEQLYQHPVFEPREGTGRHTLRAGIRDVFVFICRTGPRYSSIQELGPDALVWEWDSQAGADAPVLEYYHYKNRRKKTKLRVPLDPVALEIWQRYAGKLPVPSLGKFNEEIKLLCREAGLTRIVKEVRGSGANRQEVRVPLWQTVSAHIGRYTFITTQHEGGADIVSIQDTVGHADINTTRRYTKSREKERLTTTREAFARHRTRGTV